MAGDEDAAQEELDGREQIHGGATGEEAEAVAARRLEDIGELPLGAQRTLDRVAQQLGTGCRRGGGSGGRRRGGGGGGGDGDGRGAAKVAVQQARVLGGRVAPDVDEVVVLLLLGQLGPAVAGHVERHAPPRFLARDQPPAEVGLVARQDEVALPAVPQPVFGDPAVREPQDQAVRVRQQPVVPAVGELRPRRRAQLRRRHRRRQQGFARQPDAHAVDRVQVAQDLVDQLRRERGNDPGLSEAEAGAVGCRSGRRSRIDLLCHHRGQLWVGVGRGGCGGRGANRRGGLAILQGCWVEIDQGESTKVRISIVPALNCRCWLDCCCYCNTLFPAGRCFEVQRYLRRNSYQDQTIPLIEVPSCIRHPCWSPRSHTRCFLVRQCGRCRVETARGTDSVFVRTETEEGRWHALGNINHVVVQPYGTATLFSFTPKSPNVT